MISSVWDQNTLHYAGCALGSFEHGRFDPSNWARLSFGSSYYAPSVFHDVDNRPCLMFWMRGVEDVQEQWAGCLSVPFVIGGDDHCLALTWHPDLLQHLGTAEQSTSAELDCPALVTWSPSGDARLLLGSASLRAEPGRLLLERPGVEEEALPYSGGAVDVLVDGPTIEILASGLVLGGAVEPIGLVSSTAGRITVRRLHERKDT